MHPLKRTARVAGFLYLLIVLAGPFLLMYVPSKLFVPGDALATANNILSHETMMRVHIVLGLITQLLFIGVALALYRLLKGVNVELATVMVLLVLLVSPLAFLSVANEVGTLTFLRDPQFLSPFATPERAAVTTLLLNFDQAGIYVSEMFWGLWLLPLGMLVYRSGFLPRFLGVWLFINGLAYVALSLLGLLVPGQYAISFKIATPILLGEVALMLWLLIVGVREPAQADVSRIRA